MRRIVAALFLFGISFGYVEAAVVVYLRAIYDPIRQHIHPERKPGDLFPLITPGNWPTPAPRILADSLIEVGREAATMLMLAPLHSRWRATFINGSQPSRSPSASGTSASTRS